MTEITSQLSTALAEDLKHNSNHLAWLASRPQLWCRPLCIQKATLRAKTSIYTSLREVTKCA